jgi:hypothetical protein
MSSRAIQEAVQKLAGVQLRDEVYLVQCTVDSVDISKRSCTCTSVTGDAIGEIPDVQLMAAVDDGFLLVPAVGSTVFVTYSKRHSPVILLFSQLDQVLLVTGDSTVTLKNGLLQFNDGSYGGLIKINDLVSKINNLENLLNDLVSKYNTHTHTGVSTGGGTSGPTATQEASSLTPTKTSDIENSLITHGK